MKTLLLLVAAVALAAATWTPDPIKTFTPNREYRYDYESQILTGIPSLNSQYSGVKVKARAIVHMESDKYVTVKLTSVELFRVKEEAGVVPTNWVSPGRLELIPTEHSTAIIESLVIPIKFRYESGLVTKVYAVRADPYWSVNIKRGIISLMNLDLNIGNPVPIESNIMKPFLGVISADYNTMSTKTAYKVIEPSILGDCETWYSMVPIPSISKLLVSKVIDTKRCAPKVMAEWGIFSGMMSGRNVAEMNQLVQPSISIDYELVGNRHNFLIKSAILTGRYAFAPVAGNMHTMDGYVLQKLNYIKDNPIGRPIPFDSAPVPLKNGLHAYIPAQDVVIRETMNNMKIAGGRLGTAKIEMVDKMLGMIVEKTAIKVEKEVPGMVQTVVSILRTLSKEEIMEVIMKYCRMDVSGADSVVAMKRTIILDILPTLPHPDVPLILMRLVKEGHVSGMYASTLINIAALATTPSPMIINELLEFVKDPAIIRQPVVQRSVILCVGVLSNKLINLHIKMAIPTRTTSVLIKNVVREIKALLEASGVEMRIAVVKAIGNSGIVDFFPDLERIVKDASQPVVLKVQAIYAMRRMAAVTPRIIRSVLLPVYLDPRAEQEIRVAAFLIIMETRPGFGTIRMIGHSLNTEPSVQMASFVYSYLQNIVRSPIPELRPLSIIVRRILATVRPVVVSPMFNSKSIDIGILGDIINTPFGIRVNKINRVNHALPVAVVSKIYAFVFGRPINMAEIGIEMEGMDAIVRKLIGINGILGDILKGRKDMTTILDPMAAIDLGEIEAVIRKLVAETELPVPKEDVLRVAAYIKVFGNELNFITLDKAAIADILAKVTSPSYVNILDKLITGYNVDIVKAVHLMDNALILPTPMGLPITLNVSAVAAVTIKGQVKVDGINSFRALFNNPRKLTISVNLRPSTHIEVYQTLGIQHDIINIGATVKRSIAADLPMSFKINIDRAVEKISVRVDVPKMVVPSVAVINKPALFHLYVPIKISSYMPSMFQVHLPRLVPIVCGAIIKSVPITMAYEVPILAMMAKVSGVVGYPLPGFFDPVLLSMSPLEVVITVEPAYNTPEAVLFEISFGDKMAAKEEVRSDSWFGWFNQGSVENIVPTPDEFVPVVVNSMIPNPIIRNFHINVLTVGGYHDAKIRSKLTVAYNPNWMIHQISWQIIGSEVVTSSWKVKFEAMIHIPRIIRAVLGCPELSTADVISSVDVSFGVSSFMENTIIVKIMPAHLSVVSRADIPAHVIENISFKAVIYYSRVSSNVRDNIICMARMIKPWIIHYITREVPTKTTSGADNVEIIVEIFPHIRKMKAIIATPVNTLYVDGLVVPQIWPFVQPVVPPTIKLANLPVLPEVTVLRKMPTDMASAIYGVCVVTPTDITTLATNIMPMPAIAPGCDIVLAHDASPQNLFTVLSTPVTATGARTLRVIVPHVNAEVTRNVMTGDVALVINGAVRTIPARGPLVITRSIGGRVMPVAEVLMAGRMLVIRAVQVGVVVEIEGLNVIVKVSPMLLSTATGLCTFVPVVPMINPSMPGAGVNAITAIVPPVHRFVVKSAQCPATGLIQAGPMAVCQMIERNMKITRISEGMSQICFSVKPVPACSGFCSPANSVSETIGFHCMPATDMTARRLVREAAERVLAEMANKVVHTHQPVMIPTECVP